MAQSEGYWPVPSDLAIRTSVEPASITSAVREAIASVDRSQPVSEIRTMTGLVEEVLNREEQQTGLLSAFALLALLLAATGIYGVISYAVSLRRREIGVRMALGASPASVLKMVLNRGLGLIAIGVAAGIGISLATARMLQSLLQGVEAHDPLTLGIAAAALLIVALTACVVPARSAANVDPVLVLRDE